MRLFEADAFEERIQAVENRAGRIAWQVVIALQVVALLIYNRIADPLENYVFWMIAAPLYIAALVSWIVRRRAGVNPYAIAEERRRLGDSAVLRSMLRTRLFYAIGWGVVIATLAVPWGRWPWSLCLGATGAIAIVVYFWYLSMRTSYMGPQQGPGPMKEEQ